MIRSSARSSGDKSAGLAGPAHGVPTVIETHAHVGDQNPLLQRAIEATRRAIADATAFDHPFTGGRVEIESPLPPDLAAYLGRLRVSG